MHALAQSPTTQGWVAPVRQATATMLRHRHPSVGDGRRLQRFTRTGMNPQLAPPVVHEVLSSPGRALDAGTRAFMETRFSRQGVPTGILARLAASPADLAVEPVDSQTE